jgi:hypothetical protein
MITNKALKTKQAVSGNPAVRVRRYFAGLTDLIIEKRRYQKTFSAVPPE